MNATDTTATKTFDVAGKLVVALNLDDRSQWPGMKVTSWDKRGRGWSCRCEAPAIVWRALQLEVSDRISHKVDTNDIRTAMRKLSAKLLMELGT